MIRALGARAAIAALATFTVTACAGTEPCESAASCPEGAVCDLDGVCRPLPTQAALRFARPVRLAPLDWGGTRSDAPSRVPADDDTLELGGDADAVVHLAFGPVPLDRPVVRAVLTMPPHPTWSGPPERAEVVARRTRRFHGTVLSRHRAPEAIGGTAVAQAVLAGGPRSLRLDVTRAVRAAADRREVRVFLAVEIAGGGGDRPWRLASPRASDPERRPRLDLLLR